MEERNLIFSAVCLLLMAGLPLWSAGKFHDDARKWSAAVISHYKNGHQFLRVYYDEGQSELPVQICLGGNCPLGTGNDRATARGAHAIAALNVVRAVHGGMEALGPVSGKCKLTLQVDGYASDTPHRDNSQLSNSRARTLCDIIDKSLVLSGAVAEKVTCEPNMKGPQSGPDKASNQRAELRMLLSCAEGVSQACFWRVVDPGFSSISFEAKAPPNGVICPPKLATAK